ncbi:class I SAM-dependent methyltransferase [Streptomyces narbonensis]
MDTRAFRLDWPEATRVFEVDHALLIAEKRRRLDAPRGRAARRQALEGPLDLTQEWMPDLEAAGFDRTRPTLWVAEALTFFLTEEQAAGLLQLLASASALGSHLAFEDLGRRLAAQPLLEALAGHPRRRRHAVDLRHGRARGVPDGERLEDHRPACRGVARRRRGPLAVRRPQRGPPGAKLPAIRAEMATA